MMTHSSKWFWLSLFVLSVLFLYYLSNIIMPFLFGALLAYLFNPLVEALVRYKIPRTLAVASLFAGVLILLVMLVLLVIPILEQQIILLGSKMLLMLNWVQQTVLPWVAQRLDIHESFDLQYLRTLITENWQTAGGVAGYMLKTLSQSGMALLGVFINILLVPVVAFYLLRDWHKVIDKCHQLIPLRMEPVVIDLVKKSDAMVIAFLRGQFLVMVMLGLLYAIGLWFVGLDLALLIGMVAGLVSIIPYLGFFVGIIMASIAGFFQFGDWWYLLWIWGVFGVGTIIESAILTPNLVGDRVGMHPVLVIFAILAGGQLFGFTGILLALPVTAVLMVLLRYAQQRYLESPIYQT